MESRREMFRVAVRLAVVISSIAAAVAIGLDAIGQVSQPALVTTVAVVGFVTSWIRTGRTTHDTHRAHRVATIPLRTG